MSESSKDRVDLKFLSGLVFVLSLGVVIAVCFATTVWHEVVYVQPDTWGAALFHFFATIIAIATIVLAVVLAAFLYSRMRWRLDLVSFCIGSIALLILCAEFFSLFFIHLKPGSPAG